MYNKYPSSVICALWAQCTSAPSSFSIICFHWRRHSNEESHQYVKLKSNNNFTSNLKEENKKKPVNFMNTSLLFYYRIQMCIPLTLYRVRVDSTWSVGYSSLRSFLHQFLQSALNKIFFIWQQNGWRWRNIICVWSRSIRKHLSHGFLFIFSIYGFNEWDEATVIAYAMQYYVVSFRFQQYSCSGNEGPSGVLGNDKRRENCGSRGRQADTLVFVIVYSFFCVWTFERWIHVEGAHI